MSDSFEITYAAHTSSCTFLLDAEGVCRRIVVAPSANRPGSSTKGRDAARSAARCVGAQYVASLDPSVSGMLAEMPRVGASMLFARVDERGRVSLVRTGLVTRFESHRVEDPFAEVPQLPSVSVETSAPVLTPSVPTPRASRTTPISRDLYEENESDRTQPIQALPPSALRGLHKRAATPRTAEQQPAARAASSAERPAPERSAARAPASAARELSGDDATLDRTSEYRSEGATRRVTWPAPGSEPPPLPTLRRPPPMAVPPSDESDPYAAHARGALPRRSEPQMVRPRADRGLRVAEPGRTPRPSLPPLVDKVAGRGRGDR
ncbi:MAG: hypothetical protein KF894_25155 [Labilithrix sp.]|nr:hypothetical protein [Labilithrix sp.]